MTRNITRLGFLAVCLAGLLAVVTQLQTATPADGVQVLFIGNSFTYYHDMPKMVAELAQAGKQRPLVFEQVTPGGCTLEKHWKDAQALAKIQSRKWDVVVLQENSMGPLARRDAMFEYGKKFDAEIKKQGAKTLLYLTWADRDKPADQKAISKAYLDLAREIKAEVAPVGIAWEAALRADDKRVLHEKNAKHPTATGSYLAACVFYASIYGKSPEGLPGGVAKLTDEEARPLQAIAWKAVEKKDP